MPGIISGALGGAGDAMVKFGLQQQNAANAMDLENLRDQNAQNRAIALQKAQIELGNQQRESMVQRVGQAKAGIIDSAINDKYAGAQPADTSTWTPEQQAAMDQSKKLDRDAMGHDINVDVQAALNTGDLSVKDAAVLNQKDASNEMRWQVAQLRADTQNAKSEAQFNLGMAKLEAALGKAGSGNTDFDKKIRLLKEAGASPREIANFITDRKQPSLLDLSTQLLSHDPMAGTKKAMTPEQARDKAKALIDLTKSLDVESGGDAPGAPPSATPPSNPGAPKVLKFDPATGTFK